MQGGPSPRCCPNGLPGGPTILPSKEYNRTRGSKLCMPSCRRRPDGTLGAAVGVQTAHQPRAEVAPSRCNLLLAGASKCGYGRVEDVAGAAATSALRCSLNGAVLHDLNVCGLLP